MAVPFLKSKDKLYKIADGDIEKATDEDIAKYLSRELGYDIERKRTKKKLEAYDDPGAYIEERDNDFKSRMTDVAKLYKLTRKRYVNAGHSYEFAENKAREIAEILMEAIKKAINEEWPVGNIDLALNVSKLKNFAGKA